MAIANNIKFCSEGKTPIVISLTLPIKITRTGYRGTRNAARWRGGFTSKGSEKQKLERYGISKSKNFFSP